MPREVGEAVKKVLRVGEPGDTREEELFRVQAAFVRWGARMMEVRRSWGGVGMWHAAEMAQLELQCAECGRHTACVMQDDGEDVCPRCIREGQLEQWAERKLPCTRCGEGVTGDEGAQICSVCRLNAGGTEVGCHGLDGEEEDRDEGCEQEEEACLVCGEPGPPGGGVCPPCEGGHGDGRARHRGAGASGKRAGKEEEAGRGEQGAKRRREGAEGVEQRPVVRCTHSCNLTAHCDGDGDMIDVGCQNTCVKCCGRKGSAACNRSCDRCCLAVCTGRCPRHCQR